MKILTSETVNKVCSIIDISYESVLNGLKTDNNWHEVLNAYDPNNKFRVFFDIDCFNLSEDPLETALNEFNTIFNCSRDDWAISCGSRDVKISYHIVSKKYYMTLYELRNLTTTLNTKYKWIDYTLLFISQMADHEYLFLRLPNQSKNSINKPAPPMKIIQGELSDFIVSSIEKLEHSTHKVSH